MRGRYGIYLLPIMLVLILIIQHQEREAAPVVSLPLAPAAVDSLGLTGEPTWFTDQMVGRTTTQKPDWIAVERIGMSVNHSNRRRTFAEMESLAACGAITDASVVQLITERVLIRGDSANVAATLERADVPWREQNENEPLPRESIFPINMSCPMAEADRTQ